MEKRLGKFKNGWGNLLSITVRIHYQLVGQVFVNMTFGMIGNLKTVIRTCFIIFLAVYRDYHDLL